MSSETQPINPKTETLNPSEIARNILESIERRDNIPQDVQDVLDLNFKNYNNQLPNLTLLRPGQIHHYIRTSVEKPSEADQRHANLLHISTTIWGNIPQNLEQELTNGYIPLNPLDEYEGKSVFTRATKMFSDENGLYRFMAGFVDLLYKLLHSQNTGELIQIAETVYIPILEAMNLQLELSLLKREVFRTQYPDLYKSAEEVAQEFQKGREDDIQIAFNLIYQLISSISNDDESFQIQGRDELHRKVNSYLLGTKPDQVSFEYAQQQFFQQHRNRDPRFYTYGRDKSLSSGLTKAMDYCQRKPNLDFLSTLSTLPDRLGFTIVVPTNREKDRLLEILNAIESTNNNIYKHPLGENNLEVISRSSGYRSIHWVFQSLGMSRPVEIHIETIDEHMVNEMLATHSSYKNRGVPIEGNQRFYQLELQLRTYGIRWRYIMEQMKKEQKKQKTPKIPKRRFRKRKNKEKRRRQSKQKPVEP